MIRLFNDLENLFMSKKKRKNAIDFCVHEYS